MKEKLKKLPNILNEWVLKEDFQSDEVTKPNLTNPTSNPDNSTSLILSHLSAIEKDLMNNKLEDALHRVLMLKKAIQNRRGKY